MDYTHDLLRDLVPPWIVLTGSPGIITLEEQMTELSSIDLILRFLIAQNLNNIENCRRTIRERFIFS